MYQNKRGGSRSQSQPRPNSRQRNHSASPQTNTFEIVRFINSIPTGTLNLRTLRNFMFRDVEPRSNSKFQVVWEMLAQNEGNFILNDKSKDIKTLTGNETIWVRTVLGLCRTHCRRGRDGRNRACDGDCGSLHVCRTFLLCSEKACPFNTKKKRCMFGHSFDTEHNIDLLKQHNLYGLHESELQNLFRRRPSRTANTLPQICIYYNKADGKMCSRENCKALHICSDYIQQCCSGNCSRNHKLTTPQVTRILELYAIDKSWPPEMLLTDLEHFMTARHRNNTGSSVGSDTDDSDNMSESSDTGGRMAERFPVQELAADLPNDQLPICAGCEELKRNINKIQLTMSWLTSQVTDLIKIVDDLRRPNNSDSGSVSKQGSASGQAEMNSLLSLSEPGQSNMKLNSTKSGKASAALPTAKKPKFVKSQPFSDFTGVPPKSSEFSGKTVVTTSDSD